MANVIDGPFVSVRAELLGADDDESWLELGEIQALSREHDDEPAFAQGSEIHRLDATPSGAETPNDLEDEPPLDLD